MSLSHSHQQEERKQPSQGHEAPEYRFLAVVQESADVFWIVTPDGLMQEPYPSWQTFTGQQERECLGRGWQNALHPAAQPQIAEAAIQAVTTGSTTKRECHIRRYDGAYRLVDLRAIPVREPAGSIREVVVCGTDITGLELSGQMCDAQVQLAMAASGVGAWDWDLVTNQIMWTNQCKALWGMSTETPITYESFLQAVHPDDRKRVDQLLACALAEHTDYQTEYHVIWPDGSMHWLSDRGRVISDVHGKPIHMIGAMIDMTDLKQAEERVTTILESISDSFWHVDTRWRITYMNQKAEELSGRSREKVLGQCLWDVVPDLLGTPFEHYYRAAMAMQQTMHFEALHPTYQRWIDVHAYPAQDGLSVYFQDITERKHGEEALRESEIRFRGLVESNIIEIVVADPEGTIYEANDAFLSLLGYTCEDLAAGGMNWVTMTAPEDRAQSVHAVEELLATGRLQPFEKDYVTKDGKRVPVLIGGPLIRREGASPLLLAFVLDLTARKEIERQKDLMLGMTSHVLKTPLAALKGTFQLLQRRVKRLGTQTDHLTPEVSAFFNDLMERLAASARQVDVQTHLINDLLDVSRITANTLELSLDHCDLASIVRETVEDLRVTAPERSLLLELPEHTTVMVLADRARISQVVTNYLTNAIRYSSADQPIHIGLTIREGVARVWVRDQGPGLTEEAQKELWQRFHQVKGVPVQSGSGKGLGLGLYICQTLIARHHGEVGVESMPGKGSTFWFTLPMVK
ncbi:hypothetical protein KSD_83480 [Ktedonobacter sp. SOSP1-85]|uniref:sensor histidine kinase n=1 Tax=Ktedonobacter sp. SOSP1-85 TaxID=2778367 RepID=UPI0019161FE9|nr:PAS domain S-box protein [Ktedonobacter sp. SOSP1-85]GHO80577.1 hypothetical protein KSD_83480 [Ktedonobacter sp. SOSP1-85]